MGSGRRAKAARRSRGDPVETLVEEIPQQSRPFVDSRKYSVDSLCKLSAVVKERPETLLPILDSCAVVRMDGFSGQTDMLPAFAWRAGYALAAADHVLEQLGAPWYRADRGETEHERWLIELRRGLDTFARICWCLRFGHSLAAIALTRWYIERWTYNVAFSYEVTRTDGEDDASYIQRVWGQYPESMRDADLSERWATLSELLHGSLSISARPTSESISISRRISGRSFTTSS